jgi:NADH-quinone oxidoreductase subunit G
VQDKNFGPLIKTIMTRCIHCTRCIRFIQDVAGIPELGATGRGEDMEVTTYVEKALSSELSGNIIDLCPVGALTSKPYAFVARPWELSKTESIDVMDAVGSNIRIDARASEVLRILPRINDDVNEEWISDKTRFACDGLRRQRLDSPYVREGGKLRAARWSEAFAAIGRRLEGMAGDRIAAIAGDLACCESMLLLKRLMASLGSSNIDCRQDGAFLPSQPRPAYLFNTAIAGIERAGALLLIGANPRLEAAVLNARIRKRWRGAEPFPIGLLGEQAELAYEYEYLGNDPRKLEALSAGDHPFAGVLREAERPMLILGIGALARPDGSAILACARRIAEQTGMISGDSWNGFNVLHTAAARVGGLDVGFVPSSGGRDLRGILDGATAGDIDFVYLLGADEVDTSRLGRAFVVYQGHHGDAGAHRADVILPGAAYTEKDATYVNLEGRVQNAWPACKPPGEAKEDWAILRALSETLGRTLPVDSLADVRRLLAETKSVFAAPDAITRSAWESFGTAGVIDGRPFTTPITNFSLTNAICRASVTMAQCVEVFTGDALMKTGTHG